MKRNAAILTSYLKEYVKYDFYFPSEKLMKEIFNQKDLELHYVSPHYYDAEKGYFTQHVVIGEDDLQIINEPYKPDIMWMKTSQALYHMDEMFQDADFIVTPTMRLKHIESDKYQLYKFVEEYQPLSTMLSTFYFYPWLQEEFNHKVVVKPVQGSGGYGIDFYTRPELISMEIFNKYAGTESLHLVQDYKNFSKGAPDGIAESNHDLRVVFLGRKPSFCMVRVPKSGSLKSNIADGGTQYSLPIENVPTEVMELCRAVQNELNINEHDLYSLDFAYCGDDKRRWMIELNSAPGIWFPDEDKHYQYAFFHDLAEYFHDILDTHQARPEDIIKQELIAAR